MDNQSQSVLPTSAMAVTSLVLGILAIVGSWMPIINNFSFVLALLGIVFGVVGLVGTLRGKRKGKGLAIAGLVLGVVSFVVVLVTQSVYSAAVDEVAQSYNPSITSSTTASDSQDTGTSGSEKSESESFQSMSLGTTVEDSNGLAVSVDSFQTGVELKYADKPLTAITVTYTNNGDKEASFSSYDWKCQDANGVLEDYTIVIEGENELGSGRLAPGGTVSGTVYFEGDVVLALYYTNMFNDGADASWVLE